MPLFALLDPLSMFIVRQNFNRIRQQNFAHLNPKETVAAIELLTKPPLHEQSWYKAVYEQMHMHGIYQESDQQKIIEAIMSLLNKQKEIAAVKVKFTPVMKDEIDTLSTEVKLLAIASANAQLKKATERMYHTSNELAQAIILAIQNGADPNCSIRSQIYMDMPVIFTFIQNNCHQLTDIEAVIKMNVELDALFYNKSLMDCLFWRFYQSSEKIDQNLKIFDLLLSYGANPDVVGVSNNGDLNNATVLIMIVNILLSKQMSQTWKDAFVKLLEIFLEYGADHTEALKYAVEKNCKIARDVLQKYELMRLTLHERQIRRTQHVFSQQQFANVPVTTEANDLFVYQNTSANPAQLVLGEPLHITANKIQINGQGVIGLIVDQLRKLGITHNELALASHDVRIQAVSPLLIGTGNADGVVTVQYVPMNLQTNKRVIAIRIKEGQSEVQCNFFPLRFFPLRKDQMLSSENQCGDLTVLSDRAEDTRYIMGEQNPPATIVPPANNEFVIFIDVDDKNSSALPDPTDIRQVALSLSSQTIRLYKISGVVVNLVQQDFNVSQCAERILSLAQARALQLTEQIKTQNITEVSKDYSLKGFKDKLKMMLFPYGISIFSDESESIYDFIVFIEPLLLAHGIKQDLKKCFRNKQAEFSGELILNLDLSDDQLTKFMQNVNSAYEWGACRRLPNYDQVGNGVAHKAISLNLAILIEKILPKYEQLIAETFRHNSILSKYYQYVNRSSTPLEDFAAIKHKFTQASESFGLNYHHNPKAIYVEAILLRIFGINELPHRMYLSARNDRYELFASKLTLSISKELALRLVQNINASFPGAALILNPGSDANDPKLIREYEISIDNDILKGPILELYKAKLAELDTTDPDFLDELRVNCGTRQHTSRQLAESLQTVAQRFQQQPSLAASIDHFSSVLRSNKRTAQQLLVADNRLNVELLKHEAELWASGDRAAVQKLKEEKRPIKKVREELNLRVMKNGC